MSTLATPSIITINAFDPKYDHNVEFYYTDAQCVKNRAIIVDNSTYQTVYDRTVSMNKLVHTIPAGTLTAGKQYTIQIQVFDISGNSSNLSNPVLFYCYTTPTFSMNEIASPYRLANITLNLTYKQAEDEKIKSYQYILYDANKNQISGSGVCYAEVTGYTFYGLKNNTDYYVRGICTTEHGFSLDTGYTLVDVVYNTIPANILFKLENHRCSGYISLVTNMTVIGYELENDNYKIENGALTLWDNSLKYKGGFSVEGDFVLYVDAKKLPLGTFLKTEDCKFTLSIINICDAYYCELKSNDYVLYAELPKAQLSTVDGSILVNEKGQKIQIINMSYDDDDFVIFEVKRVNDIYNLKAYYKADYLKE